MDSLLALFWFAFGGDVTALGSPDFSVRDAAHRRLDRTGVLAWPALHVGRRLPGAERANRIDILLRRAAFGTDAVARAVLTVRDVPDGWEDRLGEAMAEDRPLAVTVCRAIDRAAAFRRDGQPVGNCRQWADATPYVTGCRRSEYGFVLRQARAFLFAEKPTPPRRLE